MFHSNRDLLQLQDLNNNIPQLTQSYTMNQLTMNPVLTNSIIIICDQKQFISHEFPKFDIIYNGSNYNKLSLQNIKFITQSIPILPNNISIHNYLYPYYIQYKYCFIYNDYSPILPLLIQPFISLFIPIINNFIQFLNFIFLPYFNHLSTITKYRFILCFISLILK